MLKTPILSGFLMIYKKNSLIVVNKSDLLSGDNFDAKID